MDEFKRIASCFWACEEYNLAHGLEWWLWLVVELCLLQRYAYIYTRLPICGVLEWIWWGSLPQFHERIDFQYKEQLELNWIGILNWIGNFEWNWEAHISTGKRPCGIWICLAFGNRKLSSMTPQYMVHVRLATYLCLTSLPLSLCASGPLQLSCAGRLQGFAPYNGLLYASYTDDKGTQAHMQYLYISAAMVFGMAQ